MSFFEVYWGTIAGILGSLCIGLGFVIYKQVSDEIDVVALNYARAGLGMLFFILSIFVLNKFDAIQSLTRNITIFLVLSVIFNVLIADTLYFRAQQLIGVAKAFPIVNMAPLFTLFFAHYLIDEPLTERLFIGVIFVLCGVYLAARPRNTSSLRNSSNEPNSLIWFGIGLAFIASLCWTFGTICLRIGVKDSDIFVVGAVRYIAVMLLMFPVYTLTGDMKRLIPKNRRLSYFIIGGAVLNIMLGGIFFFSSVKALGASRSKAINSTSPLFGIAASSIFLREQITKLTILGASMTVLGVWLVV